METPDPVQSHASGRPRVSIIIPARNEEISLGACLESLVAQADVNSEIIVVDDGSSDGTRNLAGSFAGVQIISAGALRPGWTGKNNAVFSGAGLARGEWLLFTDADTVHSPGSLARALAEAQRNEAALLSYSPEQEVHGFWEKAVMPVIFAELAAAYRPADVSDPASAQAAANGQYILISREAYDAVGGHAAVAASLLEDVALARAVKASGRRIFFRFGGDAVRTRMYRSLPQLQEGWTKNLALLFRSPARLAAVRFTEFILIVNTAALALAAALSNRRGVSAAAAVLCVVLLAFFFRRIRPAHFFWDANLLAIFGLPIFSYLLLRSRLSHKRNKVSWKGRSYGATRQDAEGSVGAVQAAPLPAASGGNHVAGRVTEH
jgi:glycosyltransferase involved in cell wall biosynthesis